jgi:hypothetical protein
LFGLATSTQEVTKNLFKVQLSLFCNFNVENIDGLDPLIWWFVNQSRLSNIGSLGRQILGIPNSQIEIEQIFSIAGVLTSL